MSARDVAGIRLFHEEHGSGAPILCIHGTGSSAVVWGDAIERLARRGRVIAYDRRGCSRSERPDPYERTSVSEHADDAAALLDALGATPALVVGRSYGGEVALELALRHPDRVRALVLLEGAPLALVPAGAAWERALAERLDEVATHAGVDAVAEALIGEALGDGAWASLPEAIRRLLTANGQAILAEVRGGGLHADPAALATIGRPVLLVAATDSRPEFRQATEALAGVLPDARTTIVDGGHLVDPAGPDVVTFLDEVSGSPAA
jgi:pimeloyl-ACP methyl ester carboxylesterase